MPWVRTTGKKAWIFLGLEEVGLTSGKSKASGQCGRWCGKRTVLFKGRRQESLVGEGDGVGLVQEGVLGGCRSYGTINSFWEPLALVQLVLFHCKMQPRGQQMNLKNLQNNEEGKHNQA